MNDALYRELILEEYKHPRNKGTLQGASHHALAKNPLCGDEISLDLELADGVIKDVRWRGVGCAISQASASLFTEAVKGQRLEEVERMDEHDVLKLLGVEEINPMRMKCAVLVMRTLAKAIKGDTNA